MGKTPTASRQRSTGTASLVIGPLVRLDLDVVGMNRPGLADEVGFRLVCPGHAADGVQLRTSQRYICPDDPSHGPYKESELSKARQIGDDLFLVSPEQVAYVDEGDAPAGEFELHRVPAGDLDAATCPAGYTYRLRPKKDAPQALGIIWASLRQMAKGADGTALVGELKLRGLVRMYRFTAWQDCLLIHELIRPENLTQQIEDLGDVEASEQVLSQLDVVLPAEDFDPDAWRDEKAARFAELDEKLLEGETFVPPAVKALPDIDPAAAALALLGGGLADKPAAPKAKAKKPKATAAA